MTKICLWGTTMQKVADEAQFLAVLDIIEQITPDAEVTILARPRSEESVSESARTVRVIPTYRLDAVIPEIARADLLIMIGGCFMESPRQAGVCGGLVMIAKVFGTSVIGLGVTAFPYRRLWAKKLYSKVFHAMEFIAVREPSAHAALADLSIDTAICEYADPRFMLGTQGAPPIATLLSKYGLSTDKPLIGVTLRYLHDGMPNWVKRSHGYSRQAADAANESIAVALDELASVAQLVLLPMHTSLDEDRAAAAAVTAKMSKPHALRVDLPQLRSAELAALIAHCELIIANRFAAGMFSVSAGTPTISVAYEQRLIDLMTTLRLEDYVVPWLAVDNENVCSIARQAWTNRSSIRKQMEVSRRPLLDSAASNADVIAHYVT